MEKRKDCCETCRWWNRTEKWTPELCDEPEAQCKRYPPMRCFYEYNDPAPSFYWEGPWVSASNFCGEWKPE